MEYAKTRVTCCSCRLLDTQGYKLSFSGAYGSDYLSDMTTYRFELCESCIVLWSKTYMHTDWRSVTVDPPPCCDWDTREACACKRIPDRNTMNWWVDKFVCERCLRLGMDALAIPPAVFDYTIMNVGGLRNVTSNREARAYADERTAMLGQQFSWDYEAKMARALAGLCGAERECTRPATYGKMHHGLFMDELSCGEHLGVPWEWAPVDELPSIRAMFHADVRRGRPSNPAIVDQLFRLWWRRNPPPDPARFCWIQWLPSGSMLQLETVYGPSPFGMFSAQPNDVHYASALYIPPGLEHETPARTLREAFGSQVRELSIDHGKLLCVPGMGTSMVALCRAKAVDVHRHSHGVCGYDESAPFDKTVDVMPRTREEEDAFWARVEEQQKRWQVANGFVPEEPNAT